MGASMTLHAHGNQMFARINVTPFFKPLLCLLIALLMSCSTAGISNHRKADGGSFPPDGKIAFEPASSDDGILRILTLNIAHGRNQAANQLFLEKQDFEQNLRAIAALFRDIGADVIALQEADGPSRWSGNFDHIEFLAREAGYPWHYRANHAESWLFSYGTAMLSRLPVDETIQHTFKPSPPTFNKGFLLGRVNWSENDTPGALVPIDIVSVHLDYSRSSVRDGQIAELTEILKLRKNPMIILGDFNSEWLAEDSVIKRLAEDAGMRVYRQNADDLNTYNSKHRLDWILISDELAFVSYRVLPDIVSDHQAVLAEVRLRKTARATPQQAD
jgi:endonuclease/exonuclease/phosphatase family metal-dependent hydrolase